MNHLDKLENQSIFIIREAYSQFGDVAMLWSIGDSTCLLWLIRKAFFGKSVPVLHIDTSCKFKEIYEFATGTPPNGTSILSSPATDALAAASAPTRANSSAVRNLKPSAQAGHRKTKVQGPLLGYSPQRTASAPRNASSARAMKILSGTTGTSPQLWDQYKTKAAEEEHLRIHPARLAKSMSGNTSGARTSSPISTSPGRQALRSIGCETCCGPVDSHADTIDKIIDELRTTKVSERSGRAQDKESDYMMQKLRSLGYM